ncbi:G-protein subunit alpha 7 [Heterostelium album PN500]|uniref:G-protein subunit alpha 7 n=1 Tax=Heterostelium pallidum (strain ATCC 26659 / Pp 5 / PN500) TaxID=670386 RepID=D3BRC7_HETP5|nr:G-protein subunit alpha 7 [Heterostelium album PN500]EFA75959.1 G-protein subunit alpha 7 [Heterostelium album PN500]|eukprot:XP_020428093.1 G-protein subunit alpha 7 [Heterostelium album PN500]
MATPTPTPNGIAQRYKEQKVVSRAIEKQLKSEKRVLATELKLLLLGTGDSGKSTIVKQMKILHMKGYSQEDRLNHRSLINRNILEIFNSLIDGCSILNLQIAPKYEAICDKISDMYLGRKYQHLDKQIWEDLEALSKDEAIKTALISSGSKFQIHSSAEYFLASIGKFSDSNYIPTDQDILWTRVSTTSITETRFSVKGINFRMIDVGGQRGHRDKWIHYFEDVTAILFVVSLSEYDQVLEEDSTANRMTESIKVFNDTINLKWFSEVPIILFLNKRDLFSEKIKRTNLNVCFSDYQGPSTYEDGLNFIRKKLLACNKSKSIYTHVTAATDTSNISAVFDAVKDILTRQTMEDGGI